ncbi:MAG: P-loop NTPase [Candidatus Humimicrobiaceae bacterium]
MVKKSKRRKMKKKVINSIKDIEKKRTGGQNALMGYDYQLLYSCYIALHFLDTNSKVMRLEGIEDIDTYKAITDDSVIIEHIQLKYSKDKQDANFLDNILKNYLEVYLTDKKNCNRYFKLVYDMTVSKGNLSKLIDGRLDYKSKEYWDAKIRKIKSDNSNWDWINFNYEDFYKQLRFEGLSKKDIVLKIERLIIDKFDIDTGSEKLFLDALFYNIFHKAQNREEIGRIELLNIIQNTKDDIAKGFQNPAYSWIEKIDFDRLSNEKIDEDYFEGKKATPQQIAHKLPVRRIALEKTIEDTINSNIITIIKSSSGQGKTTLALQVAYNLKNEYTIYKINWCRDSKELGNITEYFNSRLKLGEKILIFFDNLNNDLKEWNKLAQVLYERLSLNYKILLTTRQDGWYLYSGDQTNLYGLKIIDIYMDIHNAEDIYNKFKEKNKIHESIKSWQSAWEKVANRQLLIEYVYLITHGEMLEERIENQIKLLSQSIDGNIKLELLRLVAFSDIIGIKIRGDKLIKYLSTNMSALQDINEIIRSIENEYFIKIKDENIYIEGLHPVRSQHLVDNLHLYQPISDTIKKLIDIIEDFDIGQLFSQIPLYLNDDKEDFYKWLVTRIQDKSYCYMVKTIQGIFSGYVLKYFKQNITIFDDADKHAGLFFFLTEINPWNDIKRTGTEVKILRELKKIQPENPNINYLINLTDTIPKLKVEESDIYIYCHYLTQSILNMPVKSVITGFGILASWLTRIDNNFKILNRLSIEDVWSKRDQFDLEELSILMYEYHKSELNTYQQFVNRYKEQIFSFLKIKTDSVCIYEKDSSIYIKYVLLPNDIKNKNANEQSVERIDTVCRFLPIYSKYCADAIKPKFEVLDNIIKGIPDESHKTISIGNVKLSFNVDIITLWQKSILSHYEFNSIYDWQKYWIDLRVQIIEFMKLNIELLEFILKHQRVPSVSLSRNQL